MLNTQAVIVKNLHGYIEIAWNHSLHGEHPLHSGSSYYLFSLDDPNAPQLISQLSALETNFKYTIPPVDCGKTIRLGLATYNNVTKTIDAITPLPPVSSIPNPPELLMVKRAHDNVVKLEWLAPKYKTEIRGYLVERSLDGIRFEEVGIASNPNYTDVGGAYKHPSNGNRYYYKISTVSFSGALSPSIIATVNVLIKEISPVPTLAQYQLPSLPLGNYRIKAVGENGYGSSPWINIHNASLQTNAPEWGNLPEVPLFRLRAISPEGDNSLVIKTHNLLVPKNSTEEYPRFRIRTVAVDGTESLAMIAKYVHRVGACCCMINKSFDFLTDMDENKMTNLTCDPQPDQGFIINKQDIPVVNRDSINLLKK